MMQGAPPDGNTGPDDADGTTTLSESASKDLLRAYGVPFAPEAEVADPGAAADAAERLGFPVVAKLSGEAIAHKTERGLVRLRLGDPDAVRQAAADLLGMADPADGQVSVLIAPMVSGSRELLAGAARDPQFGPTVMIGVGGILAEVTADVSIRLAPVDAADALDMLCELRARDLLGPFRGEPAVDRRALGAVIESLSRVITERSDVVSVDLNPLIISDGRPVAVDALVELAAPAGERSA